MYRNTLEKGTSKYYCPSCGRKTFVRYVDTRTGKYIADEVGRCDREVKCGYHLKPSEYTKITNGNPFRGMRSERECIKQPSRPLPEPVYIPGHVFEQSLQHFENNNLFKFLAKLYGFDEALSLCEWYCVGTSKHWEGATVFWYVDQYGKVTRGKVMLYDKAGHRVKGCTSSVHYFMNLGVLPELHLYGLHLLKLDKQRPIAIVESEKSAIIAAGYFREYLWMASGSLSTLTAERLRPVRDRRIVLFPDGGAFEKWRKRAGDLSTLGFTIRCSDILEKGISDIERSIGYDIADLLVDHLGKQTVASFGK